VPATAPRWRDVPQRAVMAPTCSSDQSSSTPAASEHTRRYGPVPVRPADSWPPMIRHDAWYNRAVPASRLRRMLITYPFRYGASQPRQPRPSPRPPSLSRSIARLTPCTATNGSDSGDGAREGFSPGTAKPDSVGVAGAQWIAAGYRAPMHRTWHVTSVPRRGQCRLRGDRLSDRRRGPGGPVCSDDVRHHTRAVSRHFDQRASTSSVHVEGAFLFADPEPSASSESRTGKAFSINYTPTHQLILQRQG
jgi:hypothetical protein